MICDLARNNGNKQHHKDIYSVSSKVQRVDNVDAEMVSFTTASGPPTEQPPRAGTRVFTKEIGFEHGLG